MAISNAPEDAQLRIEILFYELEKREMCVQDTMSHLGVSRTVAQRYLRELYDDGEIYISSWHNNRGLTAMYRAGREKDAPVPDGRKRQGRIVGRPNQPTSVKVNVQRDPLVAALFGGAS